MLKRIMDLFLKQEEPIPEIKTKKITRKSDLLTYFKDKRTTSYLVIDKEYYPKIYLDYYYYEDTYEFFRVCRCVKIWDDKENPWIGRLLFREGSEACGAEENVYTAIQGLEEELYVMDVKEYEEYVNNHGIAFWKHKDEQFQAGEPVILLKHPFDYEDKKQRRPEFEMRPGRLKYAVRGRGPEFVFEQPILSYSIYENGELLWKIGCNKTRIEDVNLELVQHKK